MIVRRLSAMGVLRDRENRYYTDLIPISPSIRSSRTGRVKDDDLKRPHRPRRASATSGVTTNARSLRHFIAMYADPAADVEIRKMALAILELLSARSPSRLGDDSWIVLPEGGQAAATPTA